MPMGGQADADFDWMSLLKSKGEGQDGGQAVSKNSWQQPAMPYEQPQITTLSMPQQPLEQDQPPGWGFLRAYLGK